MHRSKRKRDAEQHEGEIWNEFGNIVNEDVGQEFADVLEYRSPFLDRVDDAREIVVEQHHVRGRTGDLGAGDAHRDTDMRSLQRRRIIDAIAGHRDDVPAALERLTMRIFCSAVARAKTTSGRASTLSSSRSDRSRT